MSERMGQLLSKIGAETDGEKKLALVTEAEVLKGEIETEKKHADLLKWSEEPGVMKLDWTGKQQGTDLVKVKSDGTLDLAAAEGATLSEKAWNALCEPSYKSAWIRQAINPNGFDQADRKMLDETFRTVKNFQEGIDQAGGYFIPGDFVQEIIKRDVQPSGAIDLVRTVPVGSDRLIMPRLDYQGASDDANGDIYDNPMRIQWTGEARPPGTTTRPDLGQVEIQVFEGQIEMPYSRSLADDAGGFFVDFLVEELRNSYRLGMESVVVGGNGIAKPSGILINPGGAYQPPTVNVGNPATPNGLTDWIYSLPAQYVTPECRWLADRVNTFRTWAKMQDAAGNYIFGLAQNISGGLATQRNEVLFGYNGVFSPFMPTPGAAANVGVFGNFRRAYYLAQRLGMQVRFQDLPRDAFAYAVLRFRSGGQNVQGRALRVAVQS